MPNPWDRYADTKKKGNPWDRYAQNTSATQNLTLNSVNPRTGKGYGLYEMQGPDGTVQVPYPNVMKLSKLGYKVTPDVRERYATDRTEEIKNDPTQWKYPKRFLTSGDLDKMELPEVIEQQPGAWQNIEASVQSALQPTNKYPGKVPLGIFTPKVTAEADLNTIKRVGQVLFGIPDMGVQAWGALKDSLSNDPVRSLKGQSQLIQLHPIVQISNRIDELKQEMKTDPKLAGENLVGDAIGMWLSGKATEGVVKGVKKVPETTRSFIREQVEIPQRIERTVNKFGEESDAARSDLKAARQKTAQENVDEIRKHNEAKEAVEKRNKEVAELRAKKQKTEQELEAAAKTQDQKYADAEKKANDENNAAWDDVRAKTAGHSTDISRLQKVAEIAADQADPAGSPLFKRIIKGEQPDLPTLTNNSGAVRYVDAAGNAIDRQGMSPASFDQKIASGEIKSEPILETVNPDDPGYAELYESQYGEPPPIGGGPAQFSRLQRWYSYISNKMYGGGRVEGGLYNSYKMVRSAINDAMQDIAKQANATKELENARKLHTELMETFSDSPNEPATVASKSLQDQVPDYVKEKAREERLKKVARYDPSILTLEKHISNLKEGLAKIPEDLPEKPEVPPPPPPGTEGVGAQHPIQAAGKVTDNPLPKAPKEGAEPPFGEKKAVGTPPDITKINEENIQYLNDALRRYGKVGPWVFRLLLGGPLEHLFKQSPSVFSGTLTFGQAGLMVMTKILRGKGAMEWLLRPTAEDMKVIDTLPPQDAARLKVALKALADEEVRQDPAKGKAKISPKVAAWLAGSSASQQSKKPTLDELKKKAIELNSPSSSAAPGPQSSIAKSPKELLAQASELQNSFHRGGFAQHPSTGVQSSVKPYSHVFNPETGQIEAA